MLPIEKPDIVKVIEGEGIELRQKGRNLWTCCPFHPERTSSFCVNSERQRFKCFGCGEGGDSINFIMKYKGMSFREAISYLAIPNFKPIQDSQEIRKRELVWQFNQWCNTYSRFLCEMIRLCNQVDLLATTPDDLEITGIDVMYQQKEMYEYQLAILSDSNDEAKFNLFKEVMNYE